MGLTFLPEQRHLRGQTDRVRRRYINSDALSSLQIIQSDFHPSSQNQGPTCTASGSKESLSIYGLFHHFAHTPQGKQRLRHYFLRPTTDAALINERLDFIGVFSRPENMDALGLTIKSLKGIKNIRPVMISLRKGACGSCKSGEISNGIWSTLRSVSVQSHQQDCPINSNAQFAFHTLQILDAFAELVGAHSLPIWSKA